MTVSALRPASKTDPRAIALAIAIHVAVIGYIAFLAFVRKDVPVDVVDTPPIPAVIFDTQTPPPPPTDDIRPRPTPLAGPATVEPIPVPAVTGDTASPQPVSKPMLPYPDRALLRGKEGQVVLSIAIDGAGNVTGVRLISVSAKGWGFEENAIQSVRRWKYGPSAGARNNVRVVVDYRLEN